MTAEAARVSLRANNRDSFGGWGLSSLSAASRGARRIGGVAIVREIEPWDEMLPRGGRTSGSCARRCSTSASPSWSRCRTSCTRTWPKALRAPRRRLALEPPGRGLRGRVRRDDDRHHRHRLGQVAVLPAADAGRALARRARPRAVPVSGQGARPGPGAVAARARRQARAAGDLRRRHAARAARRPAPARQRRADQPGHAAPRDPPEPPGLGGLLQEPRGRGDRRGARLPRRLRLARGQRAAAAAAGVRDPRHVAALPARERHRRQPGRAGLAADRASRTSR